MSSSLSQERPEADRKGVSSAGSMASVLRRFRCMRTRKRQQRGLSADRIVKHNVLRDITREAEDVVNGCKTQVMARIVKVGTFYGCLRNVCHYVIPRPTTPGNLNPTCTRGCYCSGLSRRSLAKTGRYGTTSTNIDCASATIIVPGCALVHALHPCASMHWSRQAQCSLISRRF